LELVTAEIPKTKQKRLVFAKSFYFVYDCCAFVVTSCGFIYFTFALLLKIHLRFRGSFPLFHSMAGRLTIKSKHITEKDKNKYEHFYIASMTGVQQIRKGGVLHQMKSSVVG